MTKPAEQQQEQLALMLSDHAHYLEILQKLIGFPTLSAETNLPLIDYTDDFLVSHGFQTKRFYNKEGNKANLVAQIGPQKDGGFMLAGHTDVVPVEGQAWTAEPFQLSERSNRLWGRGTADMKGFLALMMEIAAAVDSSKLQRPLFLCFTYDEEIGCGGAKAFSQFWQGLAVRPSFVLIGEPTDMTLVTAHKGIQLVTTQVKGKPAHSSCPYLGVSAIVFASKLIAALDKILPAEGDVDFDPPFSTFNIGTIHGGTAINIIPEYCQFDWECRTLPSQNVAQVNEALECLTRSLKDQMHGIEVEHRIKTTVPGLKSGANLAVAAWLKGFLEGGKIGTAPFLTEAGLYQQVGIPAVVCGPGSIREAHQPDESIAINSMESYRVFLHKVVENLLLPPIKV